MGLLTTDNMHLDSIYTLYENQTTIDTNEYFIIKYSQIDINTLKYVLIKKLAMEALYRK